MSVHQRTNIRNAVKTMLSGNTAAGTRVFVNRAFSIWDSEFPVILVYTTSEQDDLFSSAPVQYRRKVQLAIEILVRLSPDIGNLDDTADSIAFDVETIMAADDSLSDTCNFAIMTSTESSIVTEGNQQCGSTRINYEVQYMQYLPASADAAPDLVTIDGKFDVVPQDGQIDLEGKVTFT